MRLLLNEAYPYIENRCNIDEITEIRIRIGQKLLVKTFFTEMFIPFVADEFFIDSVIDAATHHSRYAYEDSISSGFIDYSGGIRVGLIGTGWVNGGKTVFRKFFSLCIRIPHAIAYYPDIPEEIIRNFDSTLLISPPCGGKTTLLRELAFRLGNLNDILIIDEREEICGKDLVFNVGKRCDVIQGIPKKYVYETAIRTMAPQIVACDELFGQEDIEAVRTMIGSGIKVLATFHGYDKIPDELHALFPVKIYLSSIPRVGSIKSIVKSTEK